MKTQIVKLLALLFAANLNLVNAQQTQILGNLISVTSNGVTDTASYGPILINTNGNVVVSGNQKISSTQYDATTAANAANGALVWQQSFSSGNKAFTTANARDNAGNIYVVGAVRTSTLNGLDFFVSKANAAGVQQWIRYYNGTNSTSDVASAVAIDNTGNVYVTGASEGNTAALIDYATLKYNAAGVLQWVVRYNYGNYIDVPSSIALVGSNVIVSGSSGTSYTAWDFTTVRYAVSNGAQLSVNRQPSTGNQDKVFSMITDLTGNVYVTGTTGGANPNVKTMKLDQNLNTVWVQQYDAYGYNDAGIGIALDNSNNVLVTGFAYKSNGTRELLVMKYSNAGVLQWKKGKQPVEPASSAEGIRIKTTTSNNIFVGGNYLKNGNQDVIMMMYDQNGKETFEKIYNGTSNLTDKFLDFTFDPNYIYVSARTYSTATLDQNITIKYQYKSFTQGVATFTNGLKYEPKELIVEFNKKALKMAAINNKEKLFGKLNDFVSDTTCNKISAKLDPDKRLKFDAKTMDARKIFFKAKEADSLSQSRTGNLVKVPRYYCYLLLTMPSSISNVTANNTLATIKPDILSTELNLIYDVASTTSANDPEFSLAQAGLHPTAVYPNSHVNCDSAWSITGGESFIKVGVYDTGIDFTHPDFAGLTALGFDYVSNSSLANGDGPDHGTGVAGVISAVRNNNIGIAGIAGRDALNTANQGVTLYDCKVCDNSMCYGNYLYNGLVDGVQGTNIGGFGLNVINMSINLQYSYNNAPVIPYSPNIIKIMNDANRNGIAMAAAKGNAQTGTVSVPSYIFPGDYSDETTMSVGSVGRDGHHCLYTINCSNASTVGGNIDFSAPGTDSLVKTLNNALGYKQEDGTSHASPFVAGAAALMMSYRNSATPSWNNLVHEDCEQILQRTCTDLSQYPVYTETPGYDTVTGWGRININQAIKKINKNYYRIRHISETLGATSAVRAVATISANIILPWPAWVSNLAGNYSTDIYELTSTINFALAAGEQIVSYWPLNKECYGTKLNTAQVVTDRPYYSKIVSVSNTQAVLKTYYYRQTLSNTYMPYSPSQIQNAFTLYTYDPSGTIGLAENFENYIDFIVYPNPSSGLFDISFTADYTNTLTYKVFNILGQEVRFGNYIPEYGKNTIKLNMSDLTNGIYILNIFDSNKVLHKQKLVKD